MRDFRTISPDLLLGALSHDKPENGATFAYYHPRVVVYKRAERAPPQLLILGGLPIYVFSRHTGGDDSAQAADTATQAQTDGGEHRATQASQRRDARDSQQMCQTAVW